MDVIKIYKGFKVYFSPFHEQYVVLKPKEEDRTKSTFNRFDTVEEAEAFIDSFVPDKVLWYQREY